MKHILFVCALVPLLLSGAAAAAADSEIVTTEGMQILAGWEIDGDGAIGGESADGGSLKPRAGETLLLDVPGAPDPVPTFPLVFLANGEILSGDLGEAEDTSALGVRSVLFGEIDAPGGSVVEVRYSGIEPPSLTPPCVVLSNGDVVSGRVVSILNDRVLVESVFGEAPVDRRVIGRLVFSDDTPPTDGRDEDRYLVFLTDGQKIYAESIGGTEGAGQITVTRSGKEARVDRNRVRRIVYPGWRVEYLSKLPLEVTERVPYFDGPVEVLIDRNAAGGALWLGGRWYRHGIGARPRSRVEIPLGGNWAFLSGWVGLDDHLGKPGNAAARLVADGEVLWASDEIRGGNRPARIGLRVEGVRTLELVTDFGARGHLGDYVNWCEMLVVGK